MVTKNLEQQVINFELSLKKMSLDLPRELVFNSVTSVFQKYLDTSIRENYPIENIVKATEIYLAFVKTWQRVQNS